MARASGLSQNAITKARTIVGVIAAEPVAYTDANFPIAAALDCAGYDTIFVGVEIAAGTNPTVALELLVRDPDAVDSGTAAASRWKRLLTGSNDGVTLGALASTKTGALDGTSFQEVRVSGRLAMLRLDAVTNAAGTTSVVVLAFGGKLRPMGERHLLESRARPGVPQLAKLASGDGRHHRTRARKSAPATGDSARQADTRASRGVSTGRWPPRETAPRDGAGRCLSGDSKAAVLVGFTARKAASHHPGSWRSSPEAAAPGFDSPDPPTPRRPVDGRSRVQRSVTRPLTRRPQSRASGR